MSKPLRKTKTLEESELEPWKLCRNAMRSPVTRDRYSTRVAKFFDFYQNTRNDFRTKSGDFCKKMKKTSRGFFLYYQCYYCYSFENQGVYDNHVSIKQQGKTDYHVKAEFEKHALRRH